MAIITNQANLTYTYGATTASVLSNLATAELTAALSAAKRVLDESYRFNTDLTYILSLGNGGSAAITELPVLDNLGAYTPAGAAALLIYKATVNRFAPLAPDSTIENTASIGTENPQTVSASVSAASYADVSVEKEMSPNPVTSGCTLSVTFTIKNRGNEAATDLVLTDDFPLALSDVAVTVNGAPITDFTFENNTLTLPSGTQTTLSVPAATFTQDPTTGAVTVVPGVLTVVLTGTV